MRIWLSGALKQISETCAHMADAVAPPTRPIAGTLVLSDDAGVTASTTPDSPSTNSEDQSASPEAAHNPPDEPEFSSQSTPAATPPATSPSTDFDIYHQYPPHVLYTFRDRQAVVNDALRAYTSVPVEDEPSGLYSDPIRVLNFFQLVQQANQLSDGDYLELGSHRGFSTRVIHRFMDPTRTLFAFDTFTGFDRRDTAIEKEKYDSPWQEGSFGPTSTREVAHYVGDGCWPDNLKLVQGWFPDSFAGHEGRRWRFVHVDFDLYQPIKTALETVWDRLLPGGVVVVHDYGCYGFPGARMAVDEFCHTVGVPPTELADRWSSATFRKPLSAA